MKKELMSKVVNDGSIDIIHPTLVIERVAEIKKPTYKVETLDGAIFHKGIDEAIETYNNNPAAYAFYVEDNNKCTIEIQLLLFYKNIPFPADLQSLRSLTERLMLIINMVLDGEDLLARYCISDELEMFNKCYHFTPQLMDDFRYDIHRNLIWLQELGLHGNMVDLASACTTLIVGVKKEISPFIYEIDSKEECLPDPKYALSDGVIENRQSAISKQRLTESNLLVSKPE